jgi:ABC-type lipoprotein export system ATPase subunit
MVTSSYNTIFSTSLLGNTFVQFLVFFLPWFHASQAITDIISTVQYKGQIQSMNDIAHTVVMSYSSTSVDTFDSEWIGWSLQMLTVECVIFMVAAWLAAQLLTADGSEGRPLLSVLIPRFVRDFLFTQEVIYPGDVRGIEKERSRIDNSVRVYKVSKTFSGVQALKEVSFSLAKGEVFVLLGHNGAGKSTLINVITGLIAPTHGKVFMNGLDVETDVAEVQQTIGVCAQDDLLWDELTAKEHMLLTATFKGCVVGAPLMEAVRHVLSKVQLLDRADDFARTFSGGMKRRLSVAMSTVGDVDLLFLDGMYCTKIVECTSTTP